MISLEEVREVVTAEFKSVHDLHYLSTPVNYENFRVVDIEHRKDPFVDFSLEFTDTSRFAIGEKEIFAIGKINPIFYYQEGRGGQGKLDYLDMLINNLSFQTLNSIYYGEVRPIRVQTYPGWVGLMCMIRFEVVDHTCLL